MATDDDVDDDEPICSDSECDCNKNNPALLMDVPESPNIKVGTSIILWMLAFCGDKPFVNRSA